MGRRLLAEEAAGGVKRRDLPLAESGPPKDFVPQRLTSTPGSADRYWLALS